MIAIVNWFLRQQQQQQGQQSQAGTTGQNTIDLAQYQWLIDIYVRSGAMNDQQARDFLTHASPTTLSRAMVCRNMGTPNAPALFAPESAQTADGDTVPQGVHLGTHRTSRAYMLDWNSRPDTLTPETAAGTTGTSTMREMFQAHLRTQIQSVFGPDANMDYVRSAIEVAEGMGRQDVADRVRAGLFRANQRAVIESLNVEDSSRYARTTTSTYCNIYAYDMVSALGGYLPRVWWTQAAITRIQGGARVIPREEYNAMSPTDRRSQNVIAPIYGETVHEMNANALNAWMGTWGGSFGWTAAADATAAQEAANNGQIVIALAANRVASRSGHVTVVAAEDTDPNSANRAQRDPADPTRVTVPLQSQAGATNFKLGGRTQWWSDTNHTNGGFWIYGGAVRSPLVTPESLGARP
ncbi:MAG: hypothetical protein HUU55_05615 [Myxococcales bacterium]|nr:hypothetical protein [Myxococcales bacterium]